MRALYCSYDGALDPLGQSQVVAYLIGLAAAGHDITLISFEKPARWAQRAQRDALARRLQSAGVNWKPLRYHHGLSVVTTSYDLARAFRIARRLHKQNAFDLVHARSYPSALVAWRLHRAFGLPFIFDMRGFYPEERVEGGIWPHNGVLFRMTKALERAFYRDAAHVVTLTHASVPFIAKDLAQVESSAEVTVIPTCTDLERFRGGDSAAQGFGLAYVGSLGTWYMLDEMLRLAKRAQTLFADAHVLFLTNEPPAVVAAKARSAGLDMSRCVCETSSPNEVAARLSRVRATFFFVRATFAKKASAATKFGESLALGLPVLINAGIGDSEATVRAERVGVVTTAFSDDALDQALRELRALVAETDIAARCRHVAEKEFALSEGVARYDAIYRKLGARK